MTVKTGSVEMTLFDSEQTFQVTDQHKTLPLIICNVDDCVIDRIPAPETGWRYKDLIRHAVVADADGANAYLGDRLIGTTEF